MDAVLGHQTDAMMAAAHHEIMPTGGSVTAEQRGGVPVDGVPRRAVDDDFSNWPLFLLSLIYLIAGVSGAPATATDTVTSSVPVRFVHCVDLAGDTHLTRG
jgi:hypothetical protein